MVQFTLAMPDDLRLFQRLLFSKIVPNCKKLGLLDLRDGWLRERFQEMGIIQYEHWENTAEALTIGDAVEPIHAGPADSADTVTS
jgi:hypothetical protein